MIREAQEAVAREALHEATELHEAHGVREVAAPREAAGRREAQAVREEAMPSEAEEAVVVEVDVYRGAAALFEVQEAAVIGSPDPPRSRRAPRTP